MCRFAKAKLAPLLCAMTVLGFGSICFHKNVSVHDRDFRISLQQKFTLK